MLDNLPPPPGRVGSTCGRGGAAVRGAVEPPSSVVAELAPDAGSESAVVAVTFPDTVESADDTILVAANQYTNTDTLDNATPGNDGF